jgi:hypothetical protein
LGDSQKIEQNNKDWEPLYTGDKLTISNAVKASRNRSSSWKYGYDEKYDVVVISKTGQIGDVIEISGVKIALPKPPKSVPKGDNKWIPHEYPKELKRIGSVYEWKQRSDEFKSKYIDYIEREFDRRENGHWIMNNGVPTYLTGKYYMYLQWSKIDIGLPDYREANRVLFLHWEACVADNRSFGQCYLKIRRSGFSFMSAAEAQETASLAKESRIGILSKSGQDAKKLFTDKLVPISINYPFFFKPMQSGMDRPKTELSYSLPAKKITKRNMHETDEDDEEGLNTSIDWKNTDDNSYDGEKLLRLVHDESGKWLKPNNIKVNWNVTQTCLRVGKKIIGKCMMGSTCNALNKGGQEFKDIYMNSDVNNRNANGRTKSGLYKLFIPMEWNTEGFIDEYGFPVFETPKKPIMGIDGEEITQGVIEYWNNELESRKDDPDKYNEFLRQNPRKESHAFRDESKESIFNITKIYDQVEYNDGLLKERVITRGSFSWKNGEKDTEVIWTPDPRGRFVTSWIPPKNLQNNVLKTRSGLKPGNEHLGSFGCDSYDISGVVGGGGSKGALHGLTKFSMTDGVPSNKFFLQYIARPATAEIFFEEVLMALVFYGMPILAENNKPRLLYHLKNRGYRGFSMNRPDKEFSKLSKTEKELGGIPNTSEDVKQTHADSIASWVEEYVGYDRSGEYRPEDEIGDMPFTETLLDWANFDISNRTKYDASISSGLAIMANRKHKLTPTTKKSKIKFNFVEYDNKGNQSEIKNSWR